jgi:tetratricopeptide (TPR) repeat protein
VSAYATFALADVHLSKGNDGAAQTAVLQAEDGVERVRDAGMRWGEPVGLMLLARAYAARGEQSRAVECAEEAVEALKDVDVHEAPEILYHYVQILPETESMQQRRSEAIREAKRLVEQRAERIDDDDLRQSYLRKEVPNAVLNVATLMEQGVADGYDE